MTFSPWTGRILVLPGAIAYAGPLGPTSAHQHHALQVILAPDGIELAGADGPPQRFTAALIPADYEHTIVSPAAEGRLALFDPDSIYFCRLPVPLRSPQGIRALGALNPSALQTLIEHPLSAAWVDELLTCCGSTTETPAVMHPGVRRVQRALAERLEEGDLDLASLAAVAGLSEGRLVHAFREQVGLPIRPYILWLRIQRTGQSLIQGRTLTEAAHAAGFADASHLSRTWRRMFGLAPSDVAGWVEWIVPDDSVFTS